MEIVGREVADAIGKLNELVDRLRRDSFDSYTSMQHNVDQTLPVVGSRLMELIDREAHEFQRTVHTALCDAAGMF